MVHVTLVKPNATQKLDGMNIIIQRKVQNHQNTFEATSATTVISNAPKKVNARKNLEASYTALWKLDLNKQKDFARLVLFRNGVT